MLHRLGGVNNRNEFPHSPGGLVQQVSAGWVPSGAENLFQAPLLVTGVLLSISGVL